MGSENIHAGHRKRLRQRFLDNGLETFLPHQILELLLFYSIPREDTNVYAHLLLQRFDNLAGVFSATKDELCEIPGIGENTASLIKLIPQFCELLNDLKIERFPLDSRQAIIRYFNGIFENESEEKIYIACLDDALRLIKLCDIKFDSNRFNSSVIRRMTQEVIKTNCTQCIIAINHINRYATPTKEDLSFVSKIDEYFSAIKTNLADFVIYGTDGTRLIMDAVNSGII